MVCIGDGVWYRGGVVCIGDGVLYRRGVVCIGDGVLYRRGVVCRGAGVCSILKGVWFCTEGWSLVQRGCCLVQMGGVCII